MQNYHIRSRNSGMWGLLYHTNEAVPEKAIPGQMLDWNTPLKVCCSDHYTGCANMKNKYSSIISDHEACLGKSHSSVLENLL